MSIERILVLLILSAAIILMSFIMLICAKDESIRRHDDHRVYFTHLIRFMGRIYTK